MTNDAMIAVLQAHKDGKPIEKRRLYESVNLAPWMPCQPFVDDWCPNFAVFEYRVKPEPQVAYVNFYHDDIQTVRLARSREEANERSISGRIACVRVTFVEGQFDD